MTKWFSLFFFCSLALFATQNKIYLSPSEVCVTEEGIFVHTEEKGWHSSPNLQHDTKGFFITDHYKKRVPDGYWECPTCLLINPQSSSYCARCKFPLYGDKWSD